MEHAASDHELTEVETLDRDECLMLLATVPVGRLAVIGDRCPLVFPVNFAIDDSAIVFRTGEGTKRDASTKAIVTFQADDYDTSLRTGWSVMAHGVIEELSDPDNSFGEADLPAVGSVPWALGDKPHWMRLVPQIMTGRRVTSDVIRLI